MRKSGTLYIEARKIPGVDDGYGTDSVESHVREYLHRTYVEITVGQHIPLSELHHSDPEPQRRVDQAHIC